MKSGSSKLSCTIRGQVRYEDGKLADRVVVRLRSDAVAFETELTTEPARQVRMSRLGPGHVQPEC